MDKAKVQELLFEAMECMKQAMGEAKVAGNLDAMCVCSEQLTKLAKAITDVSTGNPTEEVMALLKGLANPT